ncbi:MAG: S41 family peptidase, partial [Eubacteriales bacterium]
DPFIDWLGNYVKTGKAKVFVIIGRDTFSSALLNAFSLKNKTGAILIGEPTGGKPNCFGEVQYFRLKNSGLLVRYSTQYYKCIKDDKMLSLFPDAECPLAFADFILNKDPCMDYIINHL